MYGYKTATVETADRSASVNISLTGNWSVIDSDDYNWLASMDGKLDGALSRALESSNGVGLSKDKSITVTCYKG